VHATVVVVPRQYPYALLMVNNNNMMSHVITIVIFLYPPPPPTIGLRAFEALAGGRFRSSESSAGHVLSSRVGHSTSFTTLYGVFREVVFRKTRS